MKNKYLNPELKVVMIGTTMMLAASESKGLYDGDSGEKGNPEKTLGREFDFDDEE